jgi:hypothetical protein
MRAPQQLVELFLLGGKRVLSRRAVELFLGQSILHVERIGPKGHFLRHAYPECPIELAVKSDGFFGGCEGAPRLQDREVAPLHRVDDRELLRANVLELDVAAFGGALNAEVDFEQL